ncbi:MAG: hypothetical protein ABFS05_01845 [Bacteroidota bacterium]
MNYRKAFYDFVRTIVITTLIVVVVSLIIFSIMPAWHYPPVYPFVVGLFFLITLVVYHFMIKALETRPARFVNIFLLTTMLKLLLYMVIMVIYALLNREVARPFIISFFILYIIYTIIEVVSLLKVNRQLGSKGTTGGKA